MPEGYRLKLGPDLLLENRSAWSQGNLEFFAQSGKKFTKLMGEVLESFRILPQSQGFWLTFVINDGVSLGEAGQLGGPGIGFGENMKMPQAVQVGDGKQWTGKGGKKSMTQFHDGLPGRGLAFADATRSRFHRQGNERTRARMAGGSP